MLAVTSQGGTLRLVDGVAFHEDIVQGTYEYFEFDVNDATLDLTVTVTAFGRGDPDLYISTATQTPTKDNNMWAANSYMADSITIAHTDPRFKVGAYYIGTNFYSCVVSLCFFFRLSCSSRLPFCVCQLS